MVMEAIDSSGGRDPDIPFAILKQVGHCIARQAIDGDRLAHCSRMENEVQRYSTRDIQSEVPNHLGFEGWSLNGDLIDARSKRWSHVAPIPIRYRVPLSPGCRFDDLN